MKELYLSKTKRGKFFLDLQVFSTRRKLDFSETPEILHYPEILDLSNFSSFLISKSSSLWSPRFSNEGLSSVLTT